MHESFKGEPQAFSLAALLYGSLYQWQQQTYSTQTETKDCEEVGGVERVIPVVRLISIALCRCPRTLNCGRETSFDTPTELGPSFHL